VYRRDAFTSKPITQHSIAYEKACIVFNLASVLSRQGALQTRENETSRKLACNCFQLAAGTYLFINDNFLHPPSTDMSRDSVLVLSNLMLGQAQECFIEGAVAEQAKKVSPNIVARLYAQVALYYKTALDGMSSSPTIKGSYDKSWTPVISAKERLFMAHANYQLSISCEAKGNYGEMVARLATAEACANAAVKLIGTPSSSAGGPLPALHEIVKDFAAVVTAKHKAAVKDNDVVYHQVVPSQESLPPIEKASLAKPTTMNDTLTPEQLKAIVGNDIFANLVPMSVHETASVYSEHKATLLRRLNELVSRADAELEAAISEYSNPEMVSKAKNRSSGPPGDCAEKAGILRSEEESDPAVQLEVAITEMSARAAEALDAVSMKLDSELSEYEKARVRCQRIQSPYSETGYSRCIPQFVSRALSNAFRMLSYLNEI
jgi:hypothetical protein